MNEFKYHKIGRQKKLKVRYHDTEIEELNNRITPLVRLNIT